MTTRRPPKLPAKATAKRPPGLRTRERADGSVRIWWEPSADQRARGFAATELPASLTAATAEARRINARWAEAQATGGTAPRKGPARTVEALIAEFRNSAHWHKRLSDKTRASYARVFNLLAAKWGHDPAADFDVPTMHTWYQALYRDRSPRMAQALIAHMSILMAHAVRIGWRQDNPCLRLQVAAPDPRDRVATWAEFDALVQAAETRGWLGLALALRLALFQGQRQTDVRTARRGDFALIPVLHPGEAEARPGWVWAFRQSKRGRVVRMQVHPDVVPALRRALAETGTASAPLTATDTLIRDEATGAALSEDLFSRRFGTIRADAARAVPTVATLQFRDLRRTFAVLARQGGTDDADVADALGNSAADNPMLRQTYMPAQLTTTSRAVAAVQRPKGKGA